MLPTYAEVMHDSAKDIDKLEAQRKSLKSKLTVYNWLLCLVFLTMIILFFYESDLFLISVVGFVIMVILWYRSRYKRVRQYREAFKHGVVAPMMKSMLKLCSLPNETDKYTYSAKFYPDRRIDNEWIKKTKLYDIKIDEITGEDLFKGTFGLTDFMFSELKLVQEQDVTDSDGGSSKSRVTMFKGILFIADFHKDFEGITILNSNVGRGGFLGRLMGRLISTSYKAPVKIKLESEAFNQQFQTRTTDEIKARYILSSSMMERLLAFKKRHKGSISVSFVDSFMCISMWSNKNYFESKLSQPVTGKHLETIYEDMKFFFGWIEEFDLNTRIWSKD